MIPVTIWHMSLCQYTAIYMLACEASAKRFKGTQMYCIVNVTGTGHVTCLQTQTIQKMVVTFTLCTGGASSGCPWVPPT